jgi:hypothetical protein
MENKDLNKLSYHMRGFSRILFEEDYEETKLQCCKVMKYGHRHLT